MLKDLTPSQRALADYMSELSEDAYCAGWLVGLEFELWEVVLGERKEFGFLDLGGEEAQRLRELSDRCAGWIIYDRDTEETWMPKSEWERWYSKWREEGKPGKLPESYQPAIRPVLIREGLNFIELVPIDRVPDGLPTAGDVQLSVTVQSQGFTGSGSAWIEARKLRAFVSQLRELETSRRGTAEIESMSPGQFRLRLFSTDSLGHMALAGRISRGEHALDFRFEFDPGLLPEIAQRFEVITEPALPRP
jgi:hypothetical protein